MTEQAQHDQRLEDLLHLRLLVSYLGEQAQYNWWSSMFIGTTGASVLAYPFPRTAHLAQYHGVVQAARKTHDDLIGIGKVIHLFRVPEEVEQDLHAMVLQRGPSGLCFIASGRDEALAKLLELADTPTSQQFGPVLIGEPGQFLAQDAIRKIAGIYAASFVSGQRAYPYFKAI